MAFGAAAAAAGLSSGAAMAMSAFVFAGAAQFTALGLWPPTAETLTAIFAATLAVNARFVIYGATAAPFVSGSSALARYATAFFLSDENWALATQSHAEGGRDVGVLLGAGVLLWAAWVFGTALGLMTGVLPIAPRMLGLDALMTTFFVAILVSSWRGAVDLWPWLAAGFAALVSARLLPSGYAIAGAAMTAGVIGALCPERAAADAGS
jgi:4-azaleucine resistance transporter AzlC